MVVLVVGLGLLPAPASAEDLEVRITADNAYQVWTGTDAGVLAFVGGAENCLAGDITGAESYPGVDVGGASYLYVVAYGDDLVAQGLLAELRFGGTSVFSGHPAWEVFAVGGDRDLGCFGGAGLPGAGEVDGWIQQANSGSGAASGSTGWVDAQGGGVGRLVVGPRNDGAPGVPSFSAVPAIADTAYWMWYDHASGGASPFRDGNQGEPLVFRLPLSAVRPCAAPPRGRFTWWPFDETAGSTAHEANHGADGQWNGGPQPVAGAVGGALSFPGGADLVRVPASAELAFPAGQDFSIDLWVRSATDTSGVRTLLDKRTAPDSPLGFSLYLYQGRLGFQMADGGGSATCSTTPDASCTNWVSTPQVADGAWHFVAVSVERDGTGFFYIDGQPAETFDPSVRDGSLATTADLLIGQQAAGFLTAGFDGVLDELEIYRRALIESDLDAIYRAGASGKCKQEIHVPWDASHCLGEAVTTTTAEVCNRGPIAQPYELSFAPSPKDGGMCTAEGPAAFAVVGGRSFTLPAGGCAEKIVKITHPPGFIGSGGIACFQASAQNLATGQVVNDTGSIYDHVKDVCARPCDPIYTANSVYGVVPAFCFDAIGGTTNLAYRAEIFGPGMEPDETVFAFDGQEAGEPATGELLVRPGETTRLALPIALDEDEIKVYYDLVLSADTDGDGVDDLVTSAGLRPLAQGCAAGAEALCLNGGRFRVQVSWIDFQGNAGVGTAVPLTGDTGYFWFFRDTNVELVLKVLDGRPVNGNWWVFYGALSNVAYDITVTDTVTARSKTYRNPSGRFASVGDTAAFPPVTAVGDGAAAVHTTAQADELAAGPMRVDRFAFPAAPTTQVAAAQGSGECTAGQGVLCLNASRFEVTVQWHDFQGNSGSGHAVPLTSDTGYFWFFNQNNVELVIKVLDGRALNGNWWVFYGALSNVEYEITVTDTVTDNQKTYVNASGSFASRGDTEGLPGS